MSDQKDNVKVAIRVRPLNDRERSEATKTSVTLSEVQNTLSIEVKFEQKSFSFDYVATDNISQAEIFDVIGKPIADSCLSGYNSTIFAYGQTGAGKTFTILGPSQDPEDSQRGLLPRCFEYIFNSIEEIKLKHDIQFLIKCSYLEIYQEQINDLLDPSPQNLQLREDMKRGVYVEGLIEDVVGDIAETRNLLRIGTENRHVGSTSMNKESSRSHSVFTLTVESKEVKNGVNKFITSRFHLIDLAGSERQKATDCAGERLKEAGMINKSLSALGNVINSLVDISEGKSRHIHYRDSKLTFLLKDSLGGNSKTYIIANISPAFSATNETLSTLKFAQRAKQIKNSAYINEETSGAINTLQYEIKRLKEELQQAKESPSCFKCMCAAESQDSIQLYEVLYKTLKSKQESTEMYSKDLKENESLIENYKIALTRLENKANHDKMVLKFRDATIARLHSNCPDTEKEVIELKSEIEGLREQIENNPSVTRLYIENEKLKNSIKDEKHVAVYVERIKEAEEISTKLAENLNEMTKNFQITLDELKAEKEKNEKNFLSRISELESQNGKEIQVNPRLDELENENFELKRLMNESKSKLRKAKEEINELILKNHTNLEAKVQIELYNFELQEKVENYEKIIAIQENSNKTSSESETALKQKCKNLKNQIKDQEKQYEILLSSFQNLESQLAYESNKTIAEKKIDDEILIRHNELQLEYDSLSGHYSELQEANEELERKLQEAEQKFENLKEEMNFSSINNEKVPELESSLQSITEKYAELQSLLNEKNDLIDFYSEEIKESKILEQNNYKLINQLKKITDKNDSLSLTLQSTKQNLDEQVKKTDLLKFELQTLSSLSENYTKLLSDSKNLQQQFSDQEEKVRKLSESKEDLQEKLKKSILQQQELEKCLESLRSEYLKCKQEKTEEIHLEVNESKNTEKKAGLDDLLENYKMLQDDLKRTKSALDNFQELNLSLTQKNAELSNSLGKMHSSHIPLYIADQLRRELAEKNEELQSLKEENKQKVDILKTTKLSINATKTELASWKKLLDDKNQLITELKSEIRRLREEDSDTAEVAFLRKTLQTKDRELKELKEKGQDYYSQADEALEKMRKKCLSYQNETNSLREELRALSVAGDKFKAAKNPCEVSVKKEDFMCMKNINKKLSEELRMNRENNETLLKQVIDLNKKVNEESCNRRQKEEEMLRMVDGLKKLANYVASFASGKANSQENSVFESIARAILLVGEYRQGKKHPLLEMNNFVSNN